MRSSRDGERVAKRARPGFIAASLCAGVVALGACASRGQGVSEPSKAASARASGSSSIVLGKPRYLVPDGAWIERTSDGLDRVVANGSRIESRGASIERVGPADPEVEGGVPVPPWIVAKSAAPALRYLFWNDKDLYGAQAFLGDLEKITVAAADIARAFEWVDGTGLLTGAGALIVRGKTVAPFPIPGVVAAAASDAQRGVALTTFGHAWLAGGGSAALKDVSAELGEATRLEVRGDEIAVILAGDRRRFVNASGSIVDSSSATGPKRGARPPEIDEKLPTFDRSDRVEAAARSGVPIDGEEILIATRGHVARVAAASMKASTAAEIPEEDGMCWPFQAKDALLLACEGKERASVIDVTGPPRVERTFDLVDAADYDRFSGVDGEALGFIGPCDGTGPKPSDLDAITSASPYNSSTQRSAVFCARASRDEWIEHRLDPADSADVIAWIPRAGGEAAAIVARPGLFIADADRVSVRGKLRVVRVARSEPPLAIPAYSSRSPSVLARWGHVASDGSIEGWLPTASYPSNTAAATIDPGGHVRLRPSPSRSSALSTSGAFAMAQSEEGKLFETTDWGRTWLDADPPPGAPNARLSSCSAAGCRVGPFVRLGWSAGDPGARDRAIDVLAAKDELMTPAAQRALRERQYRRPPPASPIVRLQCSLSSPGEGARVAESFGFGVTPSPVPRTSGPSRVGWMGSMIMPWNGAQMVTSGDAELAWLSLFDRAATVRRTTIPLSRVSLDLRYRPYEVRLGYVIDADGRVDAIATGAKDGCIAPILEQAGLVRPIGGCAADTSIGVDLGGRILLHAARYGVQTISVVDLPAGGGSRGAAGSRRGGIASPDGAALLARGAQSSAAPIVIAQRELSKTSIAPGSFGYVFAVGSRAGEPVVIAVDGAGRAVLSPIDPDRGTLGAEESMASLTDVVLASDARCAAPRDAKAARVLLPFDTEIGLDRASIPGLSSAGTYGLAVLRWSPSTVCLEAVELSVRDERYELDLGYYEPPGTIRKLIARFSPLPSDRASAPAAPPPASSGAPKPPGLPAGPGNGTLALIMYGAELRQRVQCSGIAP